jgi:hypothetical protein
MVTIRSRFIYIVVVREIPQDYCKLHIDLCEAHAIWLGILSYIIVQFFNISVSARFALTLQAIDPVYLTTLKYVAVFFTFTSNNESDPYQNTLRFK